MREKGSWLRGLVKEAFSEEGPRWRQGVARGGLERSSSEQRNPQRVTLAYEALFLGSPLPPTWHFCPNFLVTTVWTVMTLEISVHCPFFGLLGDGAGVTV